MRTSIIFILILFPLITLAQAPYKGGMNDGYSMTEKKGIVIQSVPMIQQLNYSLFPNPCAVGDAIHLTIKETAETTVTIMTIDGKEIQGATVNRNVTLETTGLNPGVYLIRIRSDKKLAIAKVILQ